MRLDFSSPPLPIISVWRPKPLPAMPSGVADYPQPRVGRLIHLGLPAPSRDPGGKTA